jgi:multicomponent Na+:H+ antiporter subunit E
MLFSSIIVTLKVWLPDAKISPVLSTVRSTQTSPETQSVYGNSITLTPGTICTDISGKVIQVHALTKDGMASLKENIMDKKVTESFSG